MKTTEKKGVSLDALKDKYIGAVGTKERDDYEFDLRLDLIGEMIKKTRLERKLTQEELGTLVGVQKAQISKLERNAQNVTVETILRVFDALEATIKFRIELHSI